MEALDLFFPPYVWRSRRAAPYALEKEHKCADSFRNADVPEAHCLVSSSQRLFATTRAAAVIQLRRHRGQMERRDGGRMAGAWIRGRGRFHWSRTDGKYASQAWPAPVHTYGHRKHLPSHFLNALHSARTHSEVLNRGPGVSP